MDRDRSNDTDKRALSQQSDKLPTILTDQNHQNQQIESPDSATRHDSFVCLDERFTSFRFLQLV